MKIACRFLLLVCSAFALFLTGCGSREAGTPVVQVKGQVNFEGRPIPGAIVTLHPTASSSSSGANGSSFVVTPFGVVSEDGTFQLTTRQPADGAPEGEYYVTISWPTKGSDSDATYEQLPPKYQVAQSSGLKVKVTAGQRELDPITLTR